MSADSIEEHIKDNYEPVDGKPGYVWFNKRKFAIICRETLKEIITNYEVSEKGGKDEKNP